MQRLIKNAWQETGTTIIFVTHNTREAVCLGTRVIALGGPSLIDTAVGHIGFDSNEDEVQLFVREIESRTHSDINVGLAAEKLQKSSLAVVPVSG